MRLAPLPAPAGPALHLQPGEVAESGFGLSEPEAQSFADDGAMCGRAGDADDGDGEVAGVEGAERGEGVANCFLFAEEVGVGDCEGEGAEGGHEGEVVGKDAVQVGVAAGVGEGDDVDGVEVGVEEGGGDVAVEGVARVAVEGG